MFQRILIANRGEIAVRLIHACHEMGIEAVAVYSEADSGALHVRLADESILIGAASPGESYLRSDKLVNSAVKTGCQAIHPGYGFLSESPDFATAVREAGLVFIGPGADAIRKMGIKTEARAMMLEAGVPVAPGFQSDITSDADFEREAGRIGYPVMVKASAGGGGKGIRIVDSAADLIESLAAARREAEHAFGDSTIYIEKYIAHARHIEIQILADQHGNVVHLFERECSVQRRHQKIIEESPSPLLTSEIRARMGEAAVNAARAVGYTNTGTVEFIADENANFYFMEMNTRLQVEHPVTELVTGLDLARLQIMIASGERLPFTQADLTQRGHAIECRIYAEDPETGFLPSTGPLLRVVEPRGPGIRVDTGVASGDEVSIHYDPMIAKLVAYAEDRPAAIRKLINALNQYVIMGVTTNITFLADILQHSEFIAGNLSTHFIDDHMRNWKHHNFPLPDEALVAAAVTQMLARTESKSSVGDQVGHDVFSPWNRADTFRLNS
jgi:acetyl-CoA carboxylase biotin carboxylase subunit